MIRKQKIPPSPPAPSVRRITRSFSRQLRRSADIWGDIFRIVHASRSIRNQSNRARSTMIAGSTQSCPARAPSSVIRPGRSFGVAERPSIASPMPHSVLEQFDDRSAAEITVRAGPFSQRRSGNVKSAVTCLPRMPTISAIRSDLAASRNTSLNIIPACLNERAIITRCGLREGERERLPRWFRTITDRQCCRRSSTSHDWSSVPSSPDRVE